MAQIILSKDIIQTLAKLQKQLVLPKKANEVINGYLAQDNRDGKPEEAIKLWSDGSIIPIDVEHILAGWLEQNHYVRNTCNYFPGMFKRWSDAKRPILVKSEFEPNPETRVEDVVRFFRETLDSRAVVFIPTGDKKIPGLFVWLDYLSKHTPVVLCILPVEKTGIGKNELILVPCDEVCNKRTLKLSFQKDMEKKVNPEEITGLDLKRFDILKEEKSDEFTSGDTEEVKSYLRKVGAPFQIAEGTTRTEVPIEIVYKTLSSVFSFGTDYSYSQELKIEKETYVVYQLDSENAGNADAPHNGFYSEQQVRALLLKASAKARLEERENLQEFIEKKNANEKALAEKYEAEIEQLKNDEPFTIIETDDFIEEMLTENSKLTEIQSDLEEENRQLLYRLSEAERELETLRERNRGLVQRDQLLDSLTIPTTPLEALELAEKAFPNRLVVLPSAKESAKDFEQGRVPEIWEVLRHCSTTLYRLAIEQEENNLVEFFENETGFELALREGKMTKNNQRLMNQRTFTYNGKEIVCDIHVKGRSNRLGEAFRVYLYIDKENQKVVLGHCGGHMEIVTRQAGV